ncbi:DUF6198 family protein [Clostridium saccharobutylicum]|uniref:Membrane protein YczE n=1 Tax=Clostridium saccharobutylicum DSM 13864 TaxID=1345695 RepID=U5MPW4_CLOSA|nr:DUF6198 family protein [Clostridium saccharobutylicum]AGX42849.1 hypothetical protein CLSA_c18560 [Clostridium saccharobutylicum DSM 13864]AQR90144.1 hypothetical protein CLOSC_18510 [Clostridium saccharobutylicum]AQS00050.1 hypothetical protein CSACC_18580 [Clostridium saccharobutylicum]AQS09838.1 hypothetical protein CLOBY_19690 [Clostridium saccharobutylicum]AQS14033.1 hypothetical protein CLOSACC_18580 [Clostridium saccharobutylicum]
MKKIRISGELALFTAVIINSLGIALMTKSNFGISSISSVPYVFSQAFSILSFGTWNYTFQTILIIALMILSKKVNLSYGFSFLMGLAFGKMIDVHELWICFLPDSLVWHIIYFIMSFFILAIGICLSNNSMLPIIPTDTFPRDLSVILDKPYKYIKTTFDVCCLTTTLIISIFILHKAVGVGVGTVICALTTGKSVSLIQSFLDKHVKFYRSVVLNKPQNNNLGI